jgi:RHS repeat-associated protein
MAYDSVGNIVQKTDALNHSITFSYTDKFSDNSNHNSFAYLTQTTDAAGHSGSITYDYNTALVTQTTNMRSLSTQMAYDLMNRPVSITEPNGKTTTYSYDDSTPAATKTVTVDNAGNVAIVQNTFDKLYRITRTTTSDPEGNILVDTQYDGKGRPAQVSNPYRTGTPVNTVTTFDGLDRPTITTQPDGTTIQHAYSNNTDTVTDEASNQRRYTYNVLGQLTQVDEPYPTLSTPLTSTYLYYGFGPLYQSLQSGQTRTFTYNWLGLELNETLPESGTTTFTYDAAGRLATRVDARSITTTYSFDAVNRPTSRTYSDSTPAVSFSYDQNGFIGLRTTMTDQIGSVTYTFDNMNRRTAEQRAISGVTGTFTTSYAYNKNGDITSLTYPSGRTVNYAYNTASGVSNSRLSQITDQTTNATVASSLSYNPAGQAVTRTLGSGLAEAFAFNSRWQMTSTTETLSGNTLMSLTYDYGSTTNTGRLLTRTDNLYSEHTVAYTYDSLYRLTQASASAPSWSIAWTFDTWGNRLTQTPSGLATTRVGTQTLGYTNNHLNTYTYDAAGNQTNDAFHNYAFNADNRITQVDGGADAYGYDGDGQRVRKIVGGQTTYFFYALGSIVSEFTSTNTASAGSSSSDRLSYEPKDRLGATTLVVTASGLVIESNRTLPYGELWNTQVGSINDKKFTTYQRDQESGLDFATNRFDSSTIGRFMSVDNGPFHLKRPVTLNRYSYGGDDPVNHLDPDGSDYTSDQLSYLGSAWQSVGGFACYGNCSAENSGIPGSDAFTTSGLVGEYNSWLQNQMDVGAGNLAIHSGDWATVNALMDRNPRLALQNIPASPSVPQLADQKDKILAYLEAVGVKQFINIPSVQISDEGITFIWSDPDAALKMLSASPVMIFAHQGMLHNSQIGSNFDFRSDTTWAPGSLQVDVSKKSPLGYADIDKCNPAQDVVNLFCHGVGEVILPPTLKWIRN